MGGKLQGKRAAGGASYWTIRQLFRQERPLSFFDDDEPRTTRTRPRSPAPAAIGPPSDPQQLMVRRAAAVGIGLVVVLLLVFGIKGCLNGAKEQSLKDYNRDVSSVIQDANANTEDFFGTLAGGSSDTASTDVQSDVNLLRLRAQALTKRAEQLDVPGDMRPAQRNLLLSLSLLQEAMGKVAVKLPAALSTDSATAVPGRALDRRRDAGLRRRQRRLQPPHGGAHQAGARRQRDHRAGHPELELPAEPRLAAALDGGQAHRRAGRAGRRRRRLDGAGARAARPRPRRASASATRRSRPTPPTASARRAT